MIYTLFPSIFSSKGNFAGVAAQLNRLSSLGVTDIWIMPVTPVGKAVDGHPSFGSPYAVQNYYAVNPDYGTPSELKALVKRAHALKMRVILDEVLNHTSWDNPLIRLHPEYYVHRDSDKTNPLSIQQAFNYGDVAQLDYTNRGLRSFIVTMLQYWIKAYGVDGFRFDSADTPPGPNRMIPAYFWQDLDVALRAVKPNVLLLGEEATPDLALKPFTLDYGWPMVGPVESASKGGDASQIPLTWERQSQDFPKGMTHMSVSDDWDYPRDVNRYGGPAGALAVAAFYLTDTGIPLIYNGMEIGNAAGAVNPHAPIDWESPRPEFTHFYQQMIRLRRKNAALHSGTMAWIANTAPHQLLTYVRTAGTKQFLIEINLSPTAAFGTVSLEPGTKWTQIPIAGVPTAIANCAPLTVSLPPFGFALFERSLR